MKFEFWKNVIIYGNETELTRGKLRVDCFNFVVLKPNDKETRFRVFEFVWFFDSDVTSFWIEQFSKIRRATLVLVDTFERHFGDSFPACDTFYLRRNNVNDTITINNSVCIYWKTELIITSDFFEFLLNTVGLFSLAFKLSIFWFSLFCSLELWPLFDGEIFFNFFDADWCGSSWVGSITSSSIEVEWKAEFNSSLDVS